MSVFHRENYIQELFGNNDTYSIHYKQSEEHKRLSYEKKLLFEKYFNREDYKKVYFNVNEKKHKMHGIIILNTYKVLKWSFKIIFFLCKKIYYFFLIHDAIIYIYDLYIKLRKFIEDFNLKHDNILYHIYEYFEICIYFILVIKLYLFLKGIYVFSIIYEFIIFLTKNKSLALFMFLLLILRIFFEDIFVKRKSKDIKSFFRLKRKKKYRLILKEINRELRKLNLKN